MVSFNVYRSTYSGAYVEGICLATDEKPVTGIANGSILFAVDISTGETTRYMYDQESMSWIEAECPCSGGSGSGGSGSGGAVEPLIVHVVNENPATQATRNSLRAGPTAALWLDTKASVIRDALSKGQQVVVFDDGSAEATDGVGIVTNVIHYDATDSAPAGYYVFVGSERWMCEGDDEYPTN